MALSAKNLAKWEKARSGGFLRFVLLQGVLFYGVGSAVLYAFVLLFFTPNRFLEIFLRSLLAFPIIGIFFGIGLWWIGEANYKKAVSARDSARDS